MIDCNEWKTLKRHKYGESKMTWITMATVCHATAWAGHTKYQAAWFLLNRVYIIYVPATKLFTVVLEISLSIA